MGDGPGGKNKVMAARAFRKAEAERRRKKAKLRKERELADFVQIFSPQKKQP